MIIVHSFILSLNIFWVPTMLSYTMQEIRNTAVNESRWDPYFQGADSLLVSQIYVIQITV